MGGGWSGATVASLRVPLLPARRVTSCTAPHGPFLFEAVGVRVVRAQWVVCMGQHAKDSINSLHKEKEALMDELGLQIVKGLPYSQLFTSPVVDQKCIMSFARMIFPGEGPMVVYMTDDLTQLKHHMQMVDPEAVDLIPGDAAEVAVACKGGYFYYPFTSERFEEWRNFLTRQNPLRHEMGFGKKPVLRMILQVQATSEAIPENLGMYSRHLCMEMWLCTDHWEQLPKYVLAQSHRMHIPHTKLQGAEAGEVIATIRRNSLHDWWDAHEEALQEGMEEALRLGKSLRWNRGWCTSAAGLFDVIDWTD